MIGPAQRLQACVFLTPKPGALDVGKPTVARAARGQGFARRLVDLAEQRARVLGLSTLELQARIELSENQAIFAQLGFAKVGESAHPECLRATSTTWRKPVNPPGRG